MSIIASLTVAIFLSIVSVNAIAVVAQIPSIPSFPTEEDEDVNQQFPTTDTPSSTANVSNIPPPTISITSLEDGQQVPVGELIIEGTSSDNEESNCQVYADVNDITPLQNATAAGPSGDDNDFSQWTFVYTEDYQLITEGANELTAKISCYDGNNPTPVSEWHSVNVTGVMAGAPTTTGEPTTGEPTTGEPTTGEPTTDEGTISTDEAAPDADEADEAEENGGLAGVPPFG